MKQWISGQCGPVDCRVSNGDKVYLCIEGGIK